MEWPVCGASSGCSRTKHPTSLSPLICSVYPYLCNAVANFARDRAGVEGEKDFYVAFVDVSVVDK